MIRKRVGLGLLAGIAVVAGVVSLTAFTAQVVNITAHVEKDIALEPVICQTPGNQNIPCYVDPRGGDYGVVLPQETYVKIIELTLSSSFFEQDRYFDLGFDILWECKQFSDGRNVINNRNGIDNDLDGRIDEDPVDDEDNDGDGSIDEDSGTGVITLTPDRFPDCREDGLDDTICPIDLDVPPDGKADTVRHCDEEKLDGNLRRHIQIKSLLAGAEARCIAGLGPGSNMPQQKKIEYLGSGTLSKGAPKCRYELELTTPVCEGSFNPFTDPVQTLPKAIRCHLADKDRDGNPDLRNPQDFDEFADLGDDFKIQVIFHSSLQ